ncbi:MAG: DUF998 domain-containing protein [Rhodospirillaceae bacterium]|jgi:hypothetical protein|nr:DUF998 domain-containing protein [Rhodospirillaceae bacterium]MBT4488980.1 DUF998 domain-containing protein [Rhodospirillaceae bacterium]MBT5192766.1 DUF998 domain-containing protein [Rhodospirillaceae bacterium]MBT5898436.1 DUF998 domain-containing protein [Rhodospirillaceae bacterium]MBT6430777.1 DUF998 domain-containing protein [Rhodospirillaceae bacterium]
MSQPEIQPNTLILSYLALRKAVGGLGALLPVILAIGAALIFQTGLQDSVSYYYYTGMGNVFVGILCAIGVFLMSYRGYGIVDDRPGDPALIFVIAGVFAIGVALFPTEPLIAASTTDVTIGIIHLVFAGLFFLTIAYVSLFLFTRTDPAKTLTTIRKRRIQTYRVCGWTIVGAIILIAVQAVLPNDTRQLINPYHPVFWLESVAVVAFGVSWLTKGKAILRNGT